MRIYYILNIKDLRILLLYILIREPIKERLVKDKEKYINSIKN